jgi:hypothetical protein
MPARTPLLAALLAISALGAASDASARPPIVQPGWIMPVQERGEERRQQIRPVREILDMLRARFGGEYVSHRVEDGPRPIYVIRWRMPDGITTRDFRVDAESGQVR